MPDAPTRDDTDVIGKRVGAQIIDIILMGIVFFVVLTVFGALGGAAGPDSSVGGAISSIGVLLAIGLSLGYGFLLEGFWDGYTVGKKLLGIKAVNEDGSELSAVDAFIRNIPAPFSLGWLAYLVALLSMAESDKRQRLFDRLAGTVVVKEDSV